MLGNDTRTLTHRATHATWWSALEIVSRYGVQFVVTMVMARLLDPADFGLLAMLLVFTTFAALLAEGGLGSALVQKQDIGVNDGISVFLANLFASCLLACALWLLSPAIAGFYSQAELIPLLHLLLWMLPLGALTTVPNALLSRRLDFRKRAAAELVASLGSGGVALLLAFRGYGVWSLAWHAVTGAFLRALLLWLLSAWRPRGRFDCKAFGGLMRFGGYLLLANAMNLTFTRLQSLLIGRLFDARTLGFYTLAQDTQQAPSQFMAGLLNRVGLPMFSMVATQPAKLLGALRLSLRLSMFIFVPGMAVVAVMAKPLVVVLYGDAWTPAAPLLAVLALAAAFWPLHVLNIAALSALGRSDLVFKLEIVKATISLPLILIAAHLGVQAVAWAVLVASLVSVRVNTWYSHELLGHGLRAQMRDVLPTLLLVLLSTGCAWISARLVTAPLACLLVAVGAAFAAFVASASMLRLKAWCDLLDFLRVLRERRAQVEART